MSCLGIALILLLTIGAPTGEVSTQFAALPGRTDENPSAMGGYVGESQPQLKTGWVDDRLLDTGVENAFSPSIATNTSGALHVVWEQDVKGTGETDILYRVSADGGFSWDPPTLVTNGSDPESGPKIAIWPDGRVFVAYVESTGTSSRVWVARSDSGLTWESVLLSESSAGVFGNLSIIVPDFPYVAFDKTSGVVRTAHVHKTIDGGVTFQSVLELVGPPPPSILVNYYAPTLTHSETQWEGNQTPGYLQRLFAAYVRSSSGAESVRVRWSDNSGVSWSPEVVVRSGAVSLQSTTSSSSLDGAEVMLAWQEGDGSLNQDSSIGLSCLADPNDPQVGWETFSFNSSGLNDIKPVLAVDGEGGENFHLVWTVGLPQWDVVYSSHPIGSPCSSWTSPVEMSDPLGEASATFPSKGLSTQFRGGAWHPSTVWSDKRDPQEYGIFYTTPGSRVAINTDPLGRTIIIDNVSHSQSQVFSWPSGREHSLSAPTPQSGDTGTRYLWQSWSDGGARTHVITVSTLDVTYTAAFLTEHEVTMDTNPNGLVIEVDYVQNTTPFSIWREEGDDLLVSAPTPQGGVNLRYVWASWSDGFGQSHSVVVDSPKVLIANFVTEFWTTVSTSPSGLEIQVDGWAHDAPKSFWWEEDEEHVLSATPVQEGGEGIRYSWRSWSDGGELVHPITAEAAGATYTAVFATEYLITVETDPAGLEVLVDGTPHVSPEGVWLEAGTTHLIEVSSPQPSDSETRFSWERWDDGGAQGHEILVDTPGVTYAAVFATEYLITVETDPMSLEVLVDGSRYTAPRSFWWEANSAHAISVESPQGGFGFVRWSDGGAIAHTITIDGPGSLSATFAARGGVASFASWLLIPAGIILVQILLALPLWRRRARTEGGNGI